MGERNYVKEGEPLIVSAVVVARNRKETEEADPPEPPTETEQLLSLAYFEEEDDKLSRDLTIYVEDEKKWYHLLVDEEGRHYWDPDQPVVPSGEKPREETTAEVPAGEES